MAIFASIPLMVILTAFDLPSERANFVFLPLLPTFAIGMIVWGYHEYQRGAGLEVTIERDGVAVEVNRRQTVLRFDDVIGIRLVPVGFEFACILIPRSGRALRLPHEIVPLDLIRDELEITVILQLLGRIDERLARGEAVDLGVSSTRLAIATIRGIGSLLVGAAMLLNPLCFSLGLRFLRQGRLLIRQSLMAIRGGLILEQHGLRNRAKRSQNFIPWHLLDIVQTDSIGLRVRSIEGQLLALSILNDNYLPVLRLIKSRTK